MNTRTAEFSGTGIVAWLRDHLGADRVDDGNAARELAAGDFFRVTEPPICVVRPKDKHEVEKAVGAAARFGYQVHPRGGGMSFSGGYAPRSAKSITLDLGALDQVLEIDDKDLYVVVQPGCTWNTLYRTLRERGLRVPAYGPRSGHTATVGGGLSQTAMMLGSSRYGMTTEQVLGLEIVLADGRRVRTGQWAAGPGRPFYRYAGPDLTGPFLGDFGTLGVKVEIALRLMQWPEHTGTAAFAFSSFDQIHEAQAAIMRTGLAAEMIGLDEALQKLTIGGTSFAQDLQALGKLVAGKGILQGLRDAVKISAGGKRFLDNVSFSLHVVTEARHAAAIPPALAEITAIAKQFGGKQISDIVAQMIRADPYPMMDQVLGPSGERWVPMPFMVSSSHAIAAMGCLRDVLEAHRSELDLHRIEIGTLVGCYAPVLTSLTLMFYWPDRPTPLHRATASAEKVAQGDRFPDNPEARAFLSYLWDRMMEATAQFGAVYIGVGGPDLRFRQGREAASYELLRTIKHALDPSATLSPGAFGLSSDGFPGG